MDSYQPIYDAVRSRMSNGDVGAAIERAISSAGFGDCASRLLGWAQETINEYARPSAVYRPQLGIDGNMYCALYGLNIQEGCAGFGPTPESAMRDFDSNWYRMTAGPKP